MYKKIIEIEINDIRYEAEILLPEYDESLNRNPNNYKVVIENADEDLILYLNDRLVNTEYHNSKPIASSYKIDCKIFYKKLHVGTLKGVFPTIIDANFEHIVLKSDIFELEVFKLLEGTKTLNGTKIYKLGE